MRQDSCFGNLGNIMNFSIYTLGCKVNQYDSQEISENLQRNGYTAVSPSQFTDIFIVNSCTVTAESDRKTRQVVRKFKRMNPQGLVLLTGCMTQAFPKQSEDLIEADIVIGNRQNADIPRLISEYLENKERLVRYQKHEKDDVYIGGIIKNFDEHTRAFIKIQDGCNRYCSYCAIPYARGFSRSKSLEMIEKELKTVAKNGYKEVVFVGINLSDYRYEGKRLDSVVRLAENISGIERIRLGSLEPDHITADMLQKFASCSKFCPQFHISLQSGSDFVLKQMNRHYNSAEYFKLCKGIREIFNDATITTDIICGFPAETDEMFEETCKFVRKIGFEKVHIFPYSQREGTLAARMPDQIQKSVKEERCAKLNTICEGSRFDFMNAQIGKEVEVLFENSEKNNEGTTYTNRGYTRNYLPVLVVCDTDLQGEIRKITIFEQKNDILCGKI